MFQATRFWCQRGENYSLADDGFLVDPNSKSGKYYQPNAVPFSNISHKKCLALLGEPGIGKSTAIKSIKEQLTIACDGTADQLLVLDLSEYGNEDRLQREIIESKQFNDWLNGTGVLNLIVDSLDECLIRIQQVAGILLSILRRHQQMLSRLRLRVACRTADWPTQLDDGLKDLWKTENYEAFELLPLRRVDIASAAKQSGLDANSFIDAVLKADAQPLAIKPITLRFLIEEFKSRNSLPEKQNELYRFGCRLLCTETSPSRQAAKDFGTLDPDQRFAIASRMATIMTLCQKSAISVDCTSNPRGDDILPIASLTGGTERSKGNTFDVRETAVREVLSTSLFSGRGPGLLGLSHQTFAEFLTAEYLLKRDLDLTQIKSLICQSTEMEQSVVPQLTEAVGWLASMSKPVFREILSIDPVVLLRSDAATADSSERARLIEGLLTKLDNGDIVDIEWSLRHRAGRFTHPGLKDQLRPFIIDKSKAVPVRRVAIDIAEAAKVNELQGNLLAVALDRNDVYHIRDQAAHAVADLGDDAHRQQLKPLLTADEQEDPDDQLRGLAMRALWPKRLVSLEELVAAITPPRNSRLLGFYEFFLEQEFVRHLRSDELPVVLNHLCDMSREFEAENLSIGLCRMADAVVTRAMRHLDDTKTRIAMARFALSRLDECSDIYSKFAKDSDREILQKDVERRRSLISEIVRQSDKIEEQISRIPFSKTPLLCKEDFGWLLEQAVASDHPASSCYAELATWMTKGGAVEDVTKIVDSAERSTAVQNAFRHYLCSIDLNSPEAQEIKKRHHRHQEMMEQHKKPEPLNPPMTTHVKRWLERFEEGEVEAWPQLNHAMLFDECGQSGGRTWLEHDLRELPGWIDAEESTRDRIVRAAAQYLVNPAWLGTSAIRHSASAGYRALVLLAHEDSDSLRRLTSTEWAPWAPIVLSFPDTDATVQAEVPVDLVSLAYANAPDETLYALSAIIKKQSNDSEQGNIFILRKMGHHWDDQLCEELLALAMELNLKPISIGEILRELLDHGCVQAKEFAESLIKIPVPTEEPDRSIAREAARALIESSDDAGWRVVWPAFLSDTDFGRTVFESTVEWSRRKCSLAMRLNEREVAEFYLWLVNQYPIEEDPDRGGSVSQRTFIADCRGSLLENLRDKGSRAAVAAIEMIMHALPQHGWLKYYLATAKDRMHRRTWVPPKPEEVLSLCATPSSRLVRTADQLQDLLIELLDEIDQELQGEIPTAPHLWDERSEMPKDENRLSDWLKHHLEVKLKGRGIVTQREVAIRRGEGTEENRTPGESPDLYVTASVPGLLEGELDTVRVIIEVKGCWHRQLKTAMREQLVDRYLKDNPCRHGIYIVGWYMCSQWNQKDPQKGRTPAWDLKKARQFFDQQAEDLTDGDRRIRAFVLNTALRDSPKSTS